MAHPLSKAQEPRASVLQLPSYKRNSLWLNRKTKLLGASTIDNAPPLPERGDAMPRSPVPVLRIGSPMLLLPMDTQRRRTTHRRSIAQDLWQHPVVVVPNSSSVSSASDIDKPRSTSPLKRILHRRSSRPTSIATSLSMYSQSGCAQPLQRPVPKVVEEADLDLDKVEEELDATRDSMTPSAESGWTAASYHSTARCVWKDTQWDFVPPPLGVQEWVHFLESDDEEDIVFSESIEVMLPYLDSNSTTPTSTGGAPYCADSLTPTLTSESLEPRSKDDKRKRHYDKEEERTSLLCLDYDYTTAIDQIVYGEHDDASSLVELGHKSMPKPIPSHPQPAHEQQGPTFRPRQNARSSHSSDKTISRRPSSSKRGHRMSTNPRKEVVVERGTHTPAAGVLRRRSLSKTRRSNLHAGATRRSPRPAMPGGFNLHAAPLPNPKPAAMTLPSSTPALPGVYRRTPAQPSEVKALDVVTQQAPETSTKASGTCPVAKGRFGGLGGRGEDNPKSPMPKPKQKKSIFFNVVNFFAKG